MIKDALKYLEPNACVPIDMATTIMLVNALKEALALQALHDENERLGLYQDAYAQPEPDELNIAYMSGLYDGKKKRPWVGLTVDELITLEQKHIRHEDLCRAIDAKLKEKNT